MRKNREPFREKAYKNALEKYSQQGYEFEVIQANNCKSGYENIVDFASFYLVTAHLYLGSLPTIYQNGLVLNAYHLGCWMPIVGW